MEQLSHTQETNKSARPVTFINRSGAKPYRLLINEEGSLLRVKLGGLWSFKNAKGFWQMVAKECQESGLKHVIVMFQLNEKMTIKEAYSLAERAAEEFKDLGVQMAVVDANERSFPNMMFWQAAAETEAFSAAFNSIEKAEQWLKG